MPINIPNIDSSVINFFGIDVDYTPLGGSVSTIKAFYQNQHEQPALDEVDVSTNAPTIVILKADVAIPVHGDQVLIGADNYRVKKVTKDEGAFSYLLLEEYAAVSEYALQADFGDGNGWAYITADFGDGNGEVIVEGSIT